MKKKTKPKRSSKKPAKPVKRSKSASKSAKRTSAAKKPTKKPTKRTPAPKKKKSGGGAQWVKFVEKHGVVLASARDQRVPRTAQLVVAPLLLRTFFECGGLTAQVCQDFAGEMQRAGD